MQPVIAIIGTTGVGKTKLAIELARHLKRASIINADSMQVYCGMDISTNKPSSLELASAPHHMFSFVDHSQEYTVGDFTRDALAEIKEIHAESRVPILVGGTNYYIQSALYDATLNQSTLCSTHPLPARADPVSSAIHKLLVETDPALKSNSEISAFNDANPKVLLQMLEIVDPQMAARWHHNDHRKIRRSLEIFNTTGITQSQWNAEQAQQKLRYPTCVFWLFGAQSELEPRLDLRVDQMIERGLFDEIRDVWGSVSEPNYTRGVMQTIGFKEFDSYMRSLDAGDQAQSEKLKIQGVSDMKLATRQYAKRQVAWIKNKLAPQLLLDHQTQAGAIYLVDATDLAIWDSHLLPKAIAQITAFMKQEANTISGTGPVFDRLFATKQQKSGTWSKYKCDACTLKGTNELREFNGESEWLAHLSSALHKRTLAKLQNPCLRQSPAPIQKEKNAVYEWKDDDLGLNLFES